jgi:hypothetical protein
VHAVLGSPRPTLKPHRVERVAAARVDDIVYAEDGALGRVERVVTSESSAPAFLVVAVGRFLRRRHPVIPWSFVRAIDRSRRRVYVEGRSGSLARFPETLPIVH